MSQQIERSVKKYFTEEVIEGEWTSDLRLVIGARPFGKGKELITAPGLWTWQEAVKFVKICAKNQIPPAGIIDGSEPVAQW